MAASQRTFCRSTRSHSGRKRHSPASKTRKEKRSRQKASANAEMLLSATTNLTKMPEVPQQMVENNTTREPVALSEILSSALSALPGGGHLSTRMILTAS
jgi:hypothetical protein